MKPGTDAPHVDLRRNEALCRLALPARDRKRLTQAFRDHLECLPAHSRSPPFTSRLTYSLTSSFVKALSPLLSACDRSARSPLENIVIQKSGISDPEKNVMAG